MVAYFIVKMAGISGGPMATNITPMKNWKKNVPTIQKMIRPNEIWQRWWNNDSNTSWNIFYLFGY